MKTRENVQRRAFTATFLLCACSVMLVLFTACGPQTTATNTTAQDSSSVAIAAAVTTKIMPPTQTSCPANGQGRPAVTAPLAHGSQQTIVYIENSSSKSTLKSYNVSTKKTTTLVSVSGSTLTDAQVSTDGQYVLFLSGRMLQMIRMDGQGLQTLYCYPLRTGIPGNLGNLLWSPNQQLAIFEEPPAGGGPAGPTVRLLNLHTGNVETVAQSGEHVAIQLDAWLGNTQVYYTIYAPPMTFLYNNVYALNVTEPAGNNSTEVAPIVGNLWDMNLTPDGRTLILSQCGAQSGPQTTLSPPSLITAQAVHGGTLQPIYESHVHVVAQTRLSNQGLLFVIEDASYVVGPQDGLWKINTDGTDLTRLLPGHIVLAGTRTTWANVSRDGTLYAALNTVGQGAGASTEFYIGSLQGVITTLLFTTNDTIAIAGWAIQ